MEQWQKEEVNYRYAADQFQRCGVCKFFDAPSGCKIVAGLIRPVDVCDLFERAKSAEANPETAHGELTRHDVKVGSFQDDLKRKKSLRKVMPGGDDEGTDRGKLPRAGMGGKGWTRTDEGIEDMDADELQDWLDENRDKLDDDEIEQIEHAIAMKQLEDAEAGAIRRVKLAFKTMRLAGKFRPAVEAFRRGLKK